MPWWFSAAFTALLVVTVVGVSIWFLPAMFTPAPREQFIAQQGFPQGPDDPGDAGTGLVPPAVAARPGENTEEGKS